MKENHPQLHWRKSRRSGESGGTCVEVTAAGQRTQGGTSDRRVILVRDSKDPAGGVLSFDAVSWGSFTCALKRGRYDTP